MLNSAHFAHNALESSTMSANRKYARIVVASNCLFVILCRFLLLLLHYHHLAVSYHLRIFSRFYPPLAYVLICEWYKNAHTNVGWPPSDKCKCECAYVALKVKTNGYSSVSFSHSLCARVCVYNPPLLLLPTNVFPVNRMTKRYFGI